jgi:hypothetical protein
MRAFCTTFNQGHYRTLACKNQPGHPLLIGKFITNEEQRSCEVRAQKQATSVDGSMCVIESRGSCDMILGRAALASETDRTVDTWVPQSEWGPIIDRKINYQ